MASEPIHLPHLERFTDWFPDFLKKELAPYPGRGALVARMVISATLTMILIVTFRIPGGYVGALTAFLFSRENLVATARSTVFFIGAFLIGALGIPIGARLLASPPETHFLWIACSLFIAFFLLRCLTNFAAGTALAIVIANIVGIWYLPGPPGRNVELTLWQVAGTSLGALVTLGVEVVFYAVRRRDEFSEGLDTRLAIIERLMADYAAGGPVSPATQAGLAQFAVVGAGSLRRHIARASYTQLYRARMGALVALVGRSIDFAAALANAFPALSDGNQERAARLQRSLADIRLCLRTHGQQPVEATLETKPSPDTPLLSEIESMVSLMPSIFSDQHAVDPRLEPLEDAPGTTRIFILDAFSNPEHLRFILGGTLASMLCYVFYVSLDWRNLSTSITTCVLTALTSIGSSRQKQVLRISGFLLGGVIAGIGAQIFILPEIDSISGFTVLFASVTAVAAWIATSSTRLSYAGVQIAFSFYLVQLSDFSIQTDLTVARDRVLGVLLGVTMMWLVFERLFPRSAADEMVRIFVVNLRLLGALASSTARADEPASILKIRRQREEIYRHFGEVSAQSDAVPFETGPGRPGDLAARDRIRHWQAFVRSFYLLEAPLLQFRIFASDDSRSRSFAAFENDFRLECSRIFLHIAESLEKQSATHTYHGDSVASLLNRIDSSETEIEAEFSERERALLRLVRTIAEVVDRLQTEVASEGLYDVLQISAAPLRPLESEGT
ncbi:MAG TPA: FUSC family protein [Bryobacteraceae bacterium]|jgi:multidrug resistance protein MdtO|nr:FUSC family protein [Bryobacteraceae bacterium]